MRCALLVFGLLVWATSAWAQGLTDGLSHPPPTGGPYPYSPPGNWLPGQPGFPARGQTYVDPVFGMTVRRLSSNAVGSSLIYNRNGFWNADGTRYANDPASQGTIDIIDTTTGVTIRANVPWTFATESSFDPVNPDIFYFFSGSSLGQYAVSTGVSTTIRTFGGALGSMGGSVDFIDRTGRYFVLSIGGTIKVWDKQLNVVYAGGFANPAGGGWVGISPDAQWVIVGSSTFKSYAVNHATSTLASTGTTFWTLCGDHGDVVSASNGKTYVLTWNCDDATALYRVDVSLAQTAGNPTKQKADNVRLIDFPLGSQDAHISCARKSNRCFASIESPDDLFGNQGPWIPYKSEIVMIDVIALQVHRLAHHRSRSSFLDYTWQPRVNSNWDGTAAMWASNYGRNVSTYSDIYKVSVAAAGSPPTPPANFAVGVTFTKE